MKLIFTIILSSFTLLLLAQPADATYNTAGAASYIVPPGYTATVTVQAWGGGGGINGGAQSRGGGGGGGFSTNTYTVGPGTYDIYVGNGGGVGTAGEASTYNFDGTIVEAGGGQPGLGSGGGIGGVGNTANGGNGGLRVGGGGGGGGGAGACIDGSNGLDGESAVGNTGGLGAIGCMLNPGNDGDGGAGGDIAVSGSNGLIPGGGAGGKGEGGASNGVGGRGRVIVLVNSVLPIVLGDFSLSTKDGLPLLQWSTLSEINNDYFVIEKSRDGRVFTELDKVKASGNTVTKNYYELIDQVPFVGMNYYRLKQVDYDGKSQVFRTLSTKFAQDVSEIVMTQRNQGIEITSSQEHIQVTLYSAGGALLHSSTYQSGYANIDLSTYPVGVIFVKVISGGITKTFKAYR